MSRSYDRGAVKQPPKHIGVQELILDLLQPSRFSPPMATCSRLGQPYRVNRSVTYCERDNLGRIRFGSCEEGYLCCESLSVRSLDVQCGLVHLA